jgi:glycosyltransferase involved in cell wall biosynthesis
MLQVWSVFPHADKTGEKRGRYLPMKLLAQKGLAQTAILTNETEDNQNLDSYWDGLVPVIKTRRGRFSWSAKARLSLKLLDPNLPADVIFLRPWMYWTRSILLSRILYRRPYIVWLDTYHYPAQNSLRDYLYHEARYGWLLRNADLIIGETPQVTASVQKRLPKKRVIHLPMGLDMEPLKAMQAKWKSNGVSDQREQTVLFIGRISPEKRPHLLVELFSELADEFPDWRLKLVGPVMSQNGSPDPVYEQKFLQSLSDSHVRERIEWSPGLYGEDLYREYASASIYALPTDREGVPTTVIEAMYFGNAILSTPVGVIDWQLDHGRAGIIVGVHDREGMKNELRRLMATPELREQLSQSANRRVVEEFDWEMHIGTLYNEIRRLVPREKTVTAVGAAPAGNVPEKQNNVAKPIDRLLH